MESQDLHQCLVPILSHPPILTSFPSYLPILVSFIRQHRPAFCKNHSTLIATEAQEYAREIGMKYFETSAKTNLNVTEVFDDIAANLLRLPTSTRSIIRIGEPAGSDRRGKCRC
ncbi:hypothetical protein AAMO2058_000247900 [Amorphochlora amoebiformis]